MRERIHELISGIIEEHGEKIKFEVTATENPAFGHYSTNIALRLSGVLKAAPIDLARGLTDKIRQGDKNGFFEKVEFAPPGFINFWLSKKTLKDEFSKIAKRGIKFGEPPKTSKKTVVIDYSHPNIGKPMSVAHLRSTIIGAALYNCFKFSGWKMIGDNHLGDWGKQFGILIAGLKESGLSVNDVSINDLFNIYVDYSARMKENSELNERARAETKKLQSGNRENLGLWKKFYTVSLKEFKKVYKILGVKFDYYFGESSYKKMLSGVVHDALNKKIAERSEGAIIIPLSGLTPFVIQKSDGSYLYSTTDLAAVKFRVKKFKPHLILYVVDNGQSLHFEQLFSSVKKLGYVKDEELVHVKFGLVLGEDFKKLSSRTGKHISLEAVIEEAINRAKDIVSKKRPDLKEANKERIAQAVGVSALKYNDLSQNRQSDISFNWDKMLNLEGNSAPYLMYTYARLKSILRKAGRLIKFDPKFFVSEAEFDLILKIAKFPEAVEKVLATYFPHYLADYLFELSKTINSFYHLESVIKAKPGVREARLALVLSASQVLKNGLGLLGIKALEEM